ncbi:sugar phosphate isomerase/epimerase [Cognatiyoonia sp. IB215446]|uniref:sugar phosphate isomerase/epimerase family protein n=1 Tax=Cognatiyoonia sp. IB215446 TaxID=3097355 RepID=UPI002A0CBEAA|nr:sugar phosphate isomerase/epimerase [Cognatiyoonia sp. IB215446]MDX8346721.1 sugar phosphate isomerase/epimerase [Cognatiyoonia sp. IB215446]
MRISYQLYCSRNFPPLNHTLRMLAKAGFTEVEGYAGLFTDMDGLKAALDVNDLQMTSCHMGLDMIAGALDDALRIAKALGVQKVFVPYIDAEDRPRDTASWAAFGKRLAEAGKPFMDAGLIFGWHNHAFEFDVTSSGDIPLDLIAAASDDLMLELDLGWVRVAGHDPVAWINKYAGRIASVHVKDIAADGACADEDGWADVGHGIMDWPAIHEALQGAGVDHYVIEHDNPNDDNRFATRSLASVKAFEGQHS